MGRFLRRMSMVIAISSFSLTAVSCGASPATRGARTCATISLGTWSTVALAREVVVVSAESRSEGIMWVAASQGFGGLLLFGDAVPSNLVATLRYLPSLEPHHQGLAVMTDEEGGGVTRVPALVGSWPWAQVMGATLTTAQIEALGERVGRSMRAAGFTVDLAPVADIDGQPVWPSARNPDGLRSFGASPTRDAHDVVAFSEGLKLAGVVATLKHFPGLGGSSGNTDFGPARTRPWAVLRTSALLPFRVAIARGVGDVMMSNATVPGLTALPASLSKAAVDALRALGFSGTIMTDALSAGAIKALHLTPAQAALRAMIAGDDEVLGGKATSPSNGLSTATAMVNAIVAGVNNRSLSRATLESAAARVLSSVNPNFCPAAQR